MAKPRNIVRIDIDARNTHGWQVRVMREGERYSKFFSDSLHEGREGALKAAEAYRDELLDKLPDPLPSARLAAEARSTSGVAGIRLGQDRGIFRIEADALLNGTQRRVRTFSIRKWGLRKALWKACSWKAGTLYDDPGTADVQGLYDRSYSNIVRQLHERGYEEVDTEELQDAA